MFVYANFFLVNTGWCILDTLSDSSEMLKMVGSNFISAC